MDDNRRGSNPLSPLPSRSRTARVGSRSSRLRRSRPSKGGGGGFKKLFNWKWLLLVLLTVLLLIVGGCSALLMQGSTVNLDKIEEIEYASTIFDLDEKPITKIGIKREYVKIEDIEKVNPGLPEAFVKVEDARFYKHTGVDYYGMARSIVMNILKGGKAQGASTITMQVAGNVVLEDREKRYSRKVKEVATALNIERRYSKKKILEAYMNYILFGGQIHGIQMASKYYFDKDITKDKLEPQEIAYLAGLPKAPNTYNCFSTNDKLREAAEERKNVVLFKMQEDYIREPIVTQEEYEKAKATKLECNEEGRRKHSESSDHLTAYKQFVIQEITERYNITESDLSRRGYRIYTGLDVDAQKKTDEVLKEDQTFNEHENLDGGSITIDPKTGLIAAIGGGRQYVGPGFPIRSTEAKVQPGSAIKPLTVYAPAVELSNGKINEHYILKDEDIKIGNWEPKNASGGPKGEVPMVETVKHSYNLSTIALLRDHVKLETGWKYGKDAGLNLDENDKGYAPLALGGLYGGVSALEMAQAYSIFINDGEYIEAHTVKEIQQDLNEDGEFEVKEPQQEIQKVKVYDKRTAYYMTRMLKAVVDSGTGTEAKLDGRDTAGKTGTTNDGKIAYFVGYTPQYVNASFVFNTENENQIELSGGRDAGPIFKAVMEEALKNKPKLSFKNPGVEEPVAPIQLKGPQLSGKYDPSSESIHLNWTNLGSGVVYDVYRDGNKIASTPASSFSDTNIDSPNVISQLFGSKSYKYKVIAKDSSGSTEESNEITVKVSPGQDSDDGDCENPNDPNCEQSCEDNPNQPGCSDDDQGGDDNGDQSGDDNGDQGGRNRLGGGEDNGPGNGRFRGGDDDDLSSDEGGGLFP